MPNAGTIDPFSNPDSIPLKTGASAVAATDELILVTAAGEIYKISADDFAANVTSLNA